MADDQWAEFRVPPPMPADEWAAFRLSSPQAEQQPSLAADVAKALPTGVAKAGIGLAGFPGDVHEMTAGLADRAMLGVGHKVMDWTGLGPQAGTPERDEFDRLYLGIGTGTGAKAGGIPTSSDLRRGVEAVTGPLYEPKTVPGQYAQTIGEFAPGAFVGSSGPVRRAAETIIPAILSETAGQVTKGSKVEPVARLAGGLAGNLGVAASAARADAPARAIAAATRGVTPAEIEAARALEATGQRLGLPLSGAESFQGATSNGTKLADLQRSVEGSLDGGSVLSRFYADRPERIRNASGAAFDAIAPASAAPSTLGPLVAEAAGRSIANSPEGRTLAQRIWEVGPRTTAADAGPEVQSGLRSTYDRREGMRAALADRDYAAAREAPETIGIDRRITVERPGDPLVTYPQGRPSFTDAAPRPLERFTAAGAVDAAEPESLSRFIARRGGIALDGEAKATDLHRFNVPGLGNVARADGKSIDNFWRESLIEHGYLKPDLDGGAARDVTSELLRKLQNEQRGLPSYPIGHERRSGPTRSAQADEYNSAVSQAQRRLDDDLRSTGVDPSTVHPDIRDRVLGALVRGEDIEPLNAYERTIAAMRDPLSPYVKSTTVQEQISAPRFGQANPSDVVAHIDDALRTAKGSVADALQTTRSMLFSPGGPGLPRELDLSVEGLQNARAQIGTMINGAVRGGDRPTAAALEQVQARLDAALTSVPEHSEATRRFAAASEALRPFENPAVAKVIDRDDYGRGFVLPAERAAPTIEQAGPTAIRTFNEVSPAAGREAFERYVGTRMLDGATDVRGTVSGDALSRGLRENTDVLDALPTVRDRLGAVQAADASLETQRRGRIGDMSRAGSTRQAAELVLPSKPYVGGQDELADTIMRLGREAPEATRGLVRQRLADQFDTSASRLVGGEAQGGGARFAKDIAGTGQQAVNLNVVLDALGLPNARQNMADTINVFRATGTRKPQGSPTDFNQQIRETVGEMPLSAQAVTAARTGGASFLTQAGDTARRAWQGRNNATLADILSAPDSVDRIGAIVRQSLGTPFADAALRQAVQERAAAGGR